MRSPVAFDFKIKLFKDDGELVEVIYETVFVENPYDYEDDRDNAQTQVENLADAYLEDYNADDYSIELTDAG